MSDLFLLPSYNELFPMSALEAFSCEVPVLLRDLELYQSINSGYYEPAVDVDEMEAKIRQLKDDPVALGQLKQKASAAAAYYNEDHWLRSGVIIMKSKQKWSVDELEK